MRRFLTANRILSVRRLFATQRLWLVPLFALASNLCLAQNGNLILGSTTADTGSTLYQAQNSISNSGTFVVDNSASVIFQAGSSIQLMPGFHAASGTVNLTFHALINTNTLSTSITSANDPYARSAPTTETSNTLGFSAGDPAKEYVHMGGQVVAIENAAFNPTHLSIDTPSASGPAMMGTAVFGGWALDDNSGIASVTASLDGGTAQSVAYGGSRPDVCNIYPNRVGCPNVGWTWSVNTTTLSNGFHTLSVIANSANGSQATSSVQFQVNNQPYTESIPTFSASLTENPNPMTADANGYAQTTLTYNSSSPHTEIHINAPDGPLLTAGGASGSATTGNWVVNGTVFFLQDVNNNNPLTISNTLATVPSVVQASASLTPNQNPALISDGTGLTQLTLNYSAPGVTNTTVTVGANYQVVCGGGTSGSCTTGKWVANGTQFHLHNTPNGAAPSASNVIASFQAVVVDAGASSFVLTASPRTVSIGTAWDTLQVQGANGFSSPVSLSYSGLPSGSSLSYLASSLTPSAESTFFVSTPLTSRWSFVTLAGQSGSVQHNDILQIQNWPPQITGVSVSPYNAHQVTFTVSATDPESDLSYLQINIQGADNQGICAATVSLTAGPAMFPGATANGACSVVATGPALGNGGTATFSITFNIDSTQFYGPKNTAAFVVEQSGVNTSQGLGSINIPQNQ